MSTAEPLGMLPVVLKIAMWTTLSVGLIMTMVVVMMH
jgi:hypothetical protein